MTTLWDVVTDNSTLSVEPGNTFWDHLNNQAGGGGLVINPVESVSVTRNDATLAVKMNSGSVVAVKVASVPVGISSGGSSVSVQINDNEVSV